MMTKCYFKNLSESQSKEGINYQSRFPDIDFKKCLYSCSGYLNYGTCENYAENSEKGLVKVLELRKC